MVFALAAVSAGAQAQIASTEGAPGLIDLLLPLIVVIAAGVAAWWLMRRRGGLVRSDGPVQLVQVLPLGPRERVLVLRAGERLLVCGATPAQITLIAQLPAEAQARAAS